MTTRLIVPSVLAVLALGIAAAPASAQTTLRMAHGYELINPHHLASVAMVEHVEACSAGALQIDIYPSGQLGNEGAMNEQVRFGGIDIIQTGLQWAANSYPQIGVSTLPYLFRDRAHAVSYQNSDVFEELMDGYNEATGLHMLAAGYHGAFNISSRDPIEGLDDLSGMRIRTPDTALFMAFPPALGAVAVPIPFAELYLGLQQGVAHASVNPLTNTYSNNLYEVQDYVALTEHLIEFIAIVVSNDAWNRLDAELQACLREGAEVFATESAEQNVALENSLRTSMLEEGLIEFTEPDKSEFIAATEELRSQLMEEYGWSEDLVARIQAID